MIRRSQLTGIDNIAFVFLQRIDRFQTRAVGLLHDKLNLLGVHARLINFTLILLGALQRRYTIVIAA